jgi:hypothetical protein
VTVEVPDGIVNVCVRDAVVVGNVSVWLADSVWLEVELPDGSENVAEIEAVAEGKLNVWLLGADRSEEHV